MRGVDLHCHIFPPEYLRLARTQPKAIKARIYTKDGQEYSRPRRLRLPLTDDLWSVPALVEALDKAQSRRRRALGRAADAVLLG